MSLSPDNFFHSDLIKDAPDKNTIYAVKAPPSPNFQEIESVLSKIEKIDIRPTIENLRLPPASRKPLDSLVASIMIALQNATRERSYWIHNYGPRTNLFIRACDKFFHEWDYFTDLNHTHIPSSELDLPSKKRSSRPISESVAEFIEYVKKELQKKSLAKAERNWRGRVDERMAGARLYVNYLFEVYSKLLVIRIDLYQQQYKLEELQEEHTSTPPPDEMSRFNSLSKLINRLQNNFRHNKEFENLVGYILKFEYGPLRKWHVHAIFFFDGHKHHNDSSLCLKIGNYWVDDITKGTGCYWAGNLNKNKEAHERLGIGMINHFDTKKRGYLLDDVVPYLAKSDLYLQCKGCKKQKLFRRGQVKEFEGHLLGRPRMEALPIDDTEKSLASKYNASAIAFAQA